MSRLIDADELTILFEDLLNHHTEDLNRHKDIPQKYKSRIEGKIDGIVACGMDLYTMPTVKAIPIEWIKRYIAEEGIYPNRELLSVEQADAIERMIENWEKENEKS